jgi:hypothetical protein
MVVFLGAFHENIKEFCQQNARPKGSMSKEWLIQEDIVFISQYLHQANLSPSHPFTIRQGMGCSVNLGRELRAKMSSFCILNTQVMRAWVDRYNAIKVSIEPFCVVWHQIFA